jgi:hypothetical protein
MTSKTNGATINGTTVTGSARVKRGMAEIELEQFSRSVTDWEKFRGFERL